MSRPNTNYTGLSKLERCALAERIFVIYPRLKILIDKMEHCLYYSKIAAEPECMFIGGPAGAGKTTLQDYFIKKFPRTFNDDGVIVPVLCARVPNKATDKNLVTELLIKLGDSEAKKGSSYNQTTRLIGFTKGCEVLLIILDEFQHFVDKDSRRVLKTVSDWLKNLINESLKPIILMGMPYADQILDVEGNEQLQRRFSVREHLNPFGWRTDEERREFRAFLNAVDDQLPLMKSSHLSDPTMAFRFYCATNGIVGNIMKIIRRATELAVDQSVECLTLDLLVDAYDDRLRADYRDRENPFGCDKTELKIIPYKEPIPDLRSTNRRSKSKEREEKVSDVLKKN